MRESGSRYTLQCVILLCHFGKSLPIPTPLPPLMLLRYTRHPPFFMCSWWELKGSTVKRTKEKGQIVISLIFVCAFVLGSEVCGAH